ncbi:MAG: CDP-alcohol phosphatidyltransferase family protein [Actinomycetota bacterium]|nr:CDP-alcohol phosphatidyltransferase family protein [Actinomycetota bacterium]MDD5665997.1 CDP-alcohol phosphatidyltransferase family protein [Actinomycetota bacterium]
MERAWSVNEGLRRFSSAVFHPLGWVLARTMSPNFITTLSIFAAAAAAYLFALGRFVLGPWILFLAGLLDIWDGQVAKLTGRVSTYGAFLDSTADRMADFFFSLGTLYWFASQETYDVAFMVAGYMMLSSLISYVKARAEGLGVACNVGLLARPLRLLLFALPLFIFGLTENIWVFRGALYLLLVLGVETLAHRMIVIYKGAAEKDASAAADEA